MVKKPISVVLCTASFVFLATLSFSEEAKVAKDKATVSEVKIKPSSETAKSDTQPVDKKKPPLKLKKENLLDIIKNDLMTENEILGFIPELKKQKGSDRKEFYTYNIDGKDKKLEEIDEEMLQKISNRVINEAVRIRTERLIRQTQANAAIQAQAARQAEQLQRMRTQNPQLPSIPRTPPSTQVVTTPPAQAPQQPPAPPRPPQVPQPPRR